MGIYKAQICGKKKDKNEDVVYTRFDKESGFEFVGIADGQSEKEKCIEGARACLIAVADCLQKYDLSASTYGFHEQIKVEVAGKIKSLLCVLSEIFNMEEDQFSSTFACAAINRKTDSLVTVHLGDGLIASVDNNDSLGVISAPENGISRRHTYLTTSENLLTHIRVCTGKVKSHKGLFLLTDGAYETYEKMNWQCLFGEKQEISSDDQLKSLLLEMPSDDDATLVYACLN